jgi:hypothetical protein
VPEEIEEAAKFKEQDIEAAIRNLETWMDKPTEDRLPTEKISRRIAQKVS